MPLFSTPVARPRLPLELVDMIIGEVFCNSPRCSKRPGVEDAKRDLMACSLVCREWNSLAASWLFREVAFTFALVPDDLELEEALDMNPSAYTFLTSYEDGLPVCRPEPVADHIDFATRTASWYLAPDNHFALTKTLTCFINFLKTNETARKSIRSLTLESWWSSITFVELMRHIDAAELLDLLNMLPKLRELTLIDVPVAFSPDRPLSVCQPLDVLSLEGFSHCFQEDVYRLLHCFSDVDDFYLRLPGCLLHAIDGPQVPPREGKELLFRPRRLNIDGTIGQPSFPTLLTTWLFGNKDVMAAVEELDLKHWQSSVTAHAPFLSSFLRPLGTRLVRLALNIDMRGRFAPGALDFSPFPVLEQMSLRFKVRCYDAAHCRKDLEVAAQFIEKCTAGLLAFKALILGITPVRGIGISDWYPCLTEKHIQKLTNNRLERCLSEFLRTKGARRAVQIGIRLSSSEPMEDFVALEVLGAMFPTMRAKPPRRLCLKVYKGNTETLQLRLGSRRI